MRSMITYPKLYAKCRYSQLVRQVGQQVEHIFTCQKVHRNNAVNHNATCYANNAAHGCTLSAAVAHLYTP